MPVGREVVDQQVRVMAVERLPEKHTRGVGRTRQHMDAPYAMRVPQPVQQFLHPLPERRSIVRVSQGTVAEALRAAK